MLNCKVSWLALRKLQNSRAYDEGNNDILLEPYTHLKLHFRCFYPVCSVKYASRSELSVLSLIMGIN